MGVGRFDPYYKRIRDWACKDWRYHGEEERAKKEGSRWDLIMISERNRALFLLISMKPLQGNWDGAVFWCTVTSPLQPQVLVRWRLSGAEWWIALSPMSAFHHVVVRHFVQDILYSFCLNVAVAFLKKFCYKYFVHPKLVTYYFVDCNTSPFVNTNMYTTYNFVKDKWQILLYIQWRS